MFNYIIGASYPIFYLALIWGIPQVNNIRVSVHGIYSDLWLNYLDKEEILFSKDCE